MKHLLFVVFLSFFICSCNKEKNAYELITKKEPICSIINELNKDKKELKKRKKRYLTKESPESLIFNYILNEKTQYSLSYLFDAKGCFEIGFLAALSTKENATSVFDGIKNEILERPFLAPTQDNSLLRWISTDQAIRVELDYKKMDQGIILLTIQANE